MIRIINKQIIKKALICSIAFQGFSCVNNPDDIANVKKSEAEMPAMEARDVEILYSDSARLMAKVNAPVLKEYIGYFPYTEMPEGVHILFFDVNGEIRSELTANYAIHQKNQKLMYAKHNVVVFNAKGERLNTELLTWDSRLQKLYTNEFVTITTEKEVIFGEGLEANQDFSVYKILQPQGSFNIDEKENDNS